MEHDRRVTTATLPEFRDLLEEIVPALEEMLSTDHNRLKDLLAYTLAVVYHYRELSEHEELRNIIAQAAQTPAIQREVQSMGLTIAEAFESKGEKRGKKEGRLESHRRLVILCLEQKFKKGVTADIVEKIQQTTSVATLEQWLSRIMKGESLDQIGIV